MKIACLIRPSPPLIFFVNSIHRKFPVELAVVETGGSSTRRLRRAVERFGIRRCIQLSMERLVDRSRCITDNNRLLSENWHGLDHSIPRLVTEDVNSGHVLETLRQLNPDVLLDHGTSIVSKQILSTSPLALNLHWGLSPYYRGTHCTEWALLNWDPFNIGVTIHKLTHQIDGGGIAAQQRAQVTASDTVHSLNLQLTVIGTELMSRILMRLDDGSPLAFHQQDTSKGYLKTMSQWHYRHHQWIRDMEKKKLLGQMLAHPSRKPELPIISLE